MNNLSDGTFFFNSRIFQQRGPFSLALPYSGITSRNRHTSVYDETHTNFPLRVTDKRPQSERHVATTTITESSPRSRRNPFTISLPELEPEVKESSFTSRTPALAIKGSVTDTSQKPVNHFSELAPEVYKLNFTSHAQEPTTIQQTQQKKKIDQRQVNEYFKGKNKPKTNQRVLQKNNNNLPLKPLQRGSTNQASRLSRTNAQP